MKNYHIILVSICLFLSSCAPAVTYFGEQLPPTTAAIDVFYSAHDVKKDYKVIGHLSCPTDQGQEKALKSLTDYARKIGADAIVITGSAVEESGKWATDKVKAEALKYK